MNTAVSIHSADALRQVSPPPPWPLRPIIEAIPVEKSDSVLEIIADGKGCGRFLSELAAVVAQLDTSPAFPAKQRPGNLLPIRGTGAELPFDGNSFDLVISQVSFSSFETAEKVFTEMVRVAKGSARVVFLETQSSRLHKNEVIRLFVRNRLAITRYEEFSAPFRRLVIGGKCTASEYF